MFGLIKILIKQILKKIMQKFWLPRWHSFGGGGARSGQFHGEEYCTFLVYLWVYYIPRTHLTLAVVWTHSKDLRGTYKKKFTYQIILHSFPTIPTGLKLFTQPFSKLVLRFPDFQDNFSDSRLSRFPWEPWSHTLSGKPVNRPHLVGCPLRPHTAVLAVWLWYVVCQGSQYGLSGKPVNRPHLVGCPLRPHTAVLAVWLCPAWGQTSSRAAHPGYLWRWPEGTSNQQYWSFLCKSPELGWYATGFNRTHRLKSSKVLHKNMYSTAAF